VDGGRHLNNGADRPGARAKNGMNIQKIWGLIRCLLNPLACRRTARLLCDFVEGQLDERTRARLEQHLSDCPECLRYVSTYKKTIELTRSHGHPAIEMPYELQRKLRDFLRDNARLD
jgi:hypothetical protein